MPQPFIGEWCHGGGDTEYSRGRCSDPGSDGQLKISRDRFREVESECVLTRAVPSRSDYAAAFRCEGEGAVWTATYAFSINPRTGRLAMLESEREERSDQLPTEFYALPQIVQREVKETRAHCAEQSVEKWSEPDAMAGIETFYLDRDPAVLIDNRRVCGSGVFLKGGNCHTWGCDVRVYRLNRARNWEWEKILDEPMQGVMLNIGGDERLRHLVLSFPGKYVEKCGTKRDGSRSDNCEYLVSWRGGRWSWQKLGGAR